MLFPDDRTISGAALSVINNHTISGSDNVRGYTLLSLNELKYYIAQGAVFYPYAGLYDAGAWRYNGDYQTSCGVWSTDKRNSSSVNSFYMRGDEGSVYPYRSDVGYDGKYGYNVRLVRTITP